MLDSEKRFLAELTAVLFKQPAPKIKKDSKIASTQAKSSMGTLELGLSLVATLETYTESFFRQICSFLTHVEPCDTTLEIIRLVDHFVSVDSMGKSSKVYFPYYALTPIANIRFLIFWRRAWSWIHGVLCCHVCF